MTRDLLIQSVLEIKSLQRKFLNTPGPSLSYQSDSMFERKQQAQSDFERALYSMKCSVHTMWRNAPDISSGVGLSLDGLMSCLDMHEWDDALKVIRTELP